MKFSGKSCENLKKLGIKKKQEKFWENLVEVLKKFQSASFIENTAFLILNTAFYRAKYGLLPFLGMKITRNCKGWDLGVGWMSDRRYLALFQKITVSYIILMQNQRTSNLPSLLVNMFLERFENLHIVNGIYFCLR